MTIGLWCSNCQEVTDLDRHGFCARCFGSQVSVVDRPNLSAREEMLRQSYGDIQWRAPRDRELAMQIEQAQMIRKGRWIFVALMSLALCSAGFVMWWCARN